MNLRKPVLGLLGTCLLLVGLVLSGCGAQSSSNTVAYLDYNSDDGFCANILAEFQAKAKADGTEVLYYDAKNDVAKQIDQMNEAMDKGVKTIVLLAVDPDLIVPTVEKANAAGINVITVNRSLNGGKFVGVYADDKTAGAKQAEYMAEHLPQGGKVCYLRGPNSAHDAANREEGFISTLKQKRPDVQILDEAVGAWSNTNAMKITATWLSIFPQIDGIAAANDSMAQGAIAALKANGRSGVIVCGIDASDDALKAVAAGDQAITMKQDPAEEADAAYDLAKQAMSGQMPSQGYTAQFTAITKDNVSQYLH